MTAKRYYIEVVLTDHATGMRVGDTTEIHTEETPSKVISSTLKYLELKDVRK